MLPWKRIGFFLKRGQSEAGPLVRRLVDAVKTHGIDFEVNAEAARALRGSSAERFASLEELAARSDLLVVLGGDGTVLAAARAVGEHDTSILAINAGHLGFLTDIAREDAPDSLDAILDGNFEVRQRSRFQVIRTRADAPPALDLVLNDAVITKGSALARLIDLEARLGGGRLIARYRCDGLIVSTPTGSTAYNLAAGGPLVDPTVSAMVLNPICPHTLTQRPLVLPDRIEVEVRLLSGEEAILTLDGQVGVTLRPGDAIRVGRSSSPVRFVIVPPHDSFETMRKKLGWGAH